MKKYNLTIEGKKYAVEVDVNDTIASVNVNGKQFNVEIEKEKEPVITKVAKPVAKSASTPAPAASAPKAPASASAMKAPLPGQVVKILVQPGQAVKRGDTLLVMEAMKMENNIMADKDATVKAIFVEVGRTVALGDALVELE